VTTLFALIKPAPFVPKYYERQIVITNILAFIFSAVTLGVAAIYYALFGVTISTWLLVTESIIFCSIPLIIKLDYNYGRLALCVIPTLMTMAITIAFKFSIANPSYIVYLDSRFILMATVILPVICFRLQEKQFIYVSLLCTAFCVILFDPVHEIFGVGYYQKGHTELSYRYLNYVVCIIFFLISFGIMLLRSVLERSELELIQQNDNLIEKQNEIEAQTEELLQQQEEMVASSEKLEEANRVIVKQQDELETYNHALEKLVEEKSAQLINTNEELVKYNNELIQFSYTVSHNLRGPVARMLGLTRLLKRSDDDNEKNRLEDMVVKASEELDEILKDLSLIIDIRNDIYRIREKVFLQDEWNKAVNLLGTNVKSVFRLAVDFSDAPYVFGIRPMVQSIFYNLLSNAIKYQSPERKLELDIYSVKLDDQRTMIQVSDNGLGIDLKAQRNNIFKLYKRFHPHVPGKGLGLYLVKTQVETLGGVIEVESEPDFGTSFKLFFAEPETVTRQVFHESAAVALYYDGHLNIVIIEWKQQPTTQEFRDAFRAVIASLQVYRSPGWVSDITRMGSVHEEDKKWFIHEIIPQFVNQGLKQIAVTGLDPHPKKLQGFDEFRKLIGKHGFEARLFPSVEESLLWMEDSLNLKIRKHQA
jgi:signal transduction histidine kinase